MTNNIIPHKESGIRGPADESSSEALFLCRSSDKQEGKNMVIDVEPKAVSVDLAAKYLSISRSSAFSAIHRGELKACRLGKRLLVPMNAIEELLANGNVDGNQEQEK